MSLRVPVPFATLVCVASLLVPAVAAAAPEEKCIRSELEAAGRIAKAALACHATAAEKGKPVKEQCLKDARKRYNKDLAAAKDSGTCLRVLDDKAPRRDAERLAETLVREIVTTPDAADECAAKKLKAAGKRAKNLVEVHGTFAKKQDLETFLAEFAAADERLAAKFAKLEGKFACNTTGDATPVGQTVDGFADFAMGAYRLIDQQTTSIPSSAEPAETPGSAGVDASGYPKLMTQFGSADVDLNNATYTRFFYRPGTAQPDAVLILVPGFLGGALGFKVVSENLITRALEAGLALEVWALDRRGHQLEDREGLDISEDQRDAQIAIDWLFGEELGIDLGPELAAGPNRRAVFHDPQADTAFIANWTNLVFSHDIDALVEAARAVARNQNVFLGGHSAGTGFTARYAATDFDLSGVGPAQPGYSKLRGLVLLEGGGGSTSGEAPTEDELDRIEDKADGGLFFAVRDNPQAASEEDPIPGRCVDGTACELDTEAVDCAGKGNETCTPAVTAYSVLDFFGFPFINPQVLAGAEAPGIQGITDLNEGEIILIQDQGGIEGNNPVDVVGPLFGFGALPDGTVASFAGEFLDDEGLVTELFGGPSFLTGSMGGPGPVIDGLATWQSINEGPLPEILFQDIGPAPTELPGDNWGTGAEVIRVDRFLGSFFVGDSNFTDWYFPGGGLSTTSGLVSLDSTPLSVGRGRRDIENLTQAANIDIPVIAFGGSNGLTPVPGSYTAFAESVGTCATASCDGTPRVVDSGTPSEAFPTLGGVAGGFEVYISEGIAHVDVLGPEDDGSVQIYEPLVAFLQRNAQ